MESASDFEIGQGLIKIKFKMPKDPKQEMFDIHTIFSTIPDAEKFIVQNSTWLTEASIVKVHEFVVATYVNGKKV